MEEYYEADVDDDVCADVCGGVCVDVDAIVDDDVRECVCAGGVDYYGVLSLRRDCDDLEIKAAFRRLAILHNPGRRKDNRSESIFALVAEAYDVLSDPLRRAVYDRCGEEGLKSGVPGPDGFIPPYVYHGEPMRTYREFFGSETAYPDLLEDATEPPSLLEFPEGRGIKPKEEPLIKTLYLTLKEVFFGGIKKMKIQRSVLIGDCKCTTQAEEKILTIPIKPGIPSGTKIIFPQAGDESPSKTAADVIFITEERVHDAFRREGADLIAGVNVFLREALTGTVITISTLDDRTIRIPITSVITPGFRKQVVGEGLPVADNPRKRGNLILLFNVEFPVYLPVSKRSYVVKMFEGSREYADPEDTEQIHRYLLARKMRQNVDADVPLRRRPDDEANRLDDLCNS